MSYSAPLLSIHHLSKGFGGRHAMRARPESAWRTNLLDSLAAASLVAIAVLNEAWARRKPACG
jgi:hypothetical protein